MPSVSRRGFIKWTSVGIAATGVIGALSPVGALAAGTRAEPSAPPAPLPTGSSLSGPPAMQGVPLGAEPFVVYISDPSSGRGSILVGEQSIAFSNGAVVQALRQAMG